MTHDRDALRTDRFDEAAADCLRLAAGLAQLTNHPTVRASHVVLAVLQSDRGEIDSSCRELFNGLQASTLADAIRERLAVVADLNDLEPGAFDGDLPASSDLDETTVTLIAAADALAREWNRERISLGAIACAACRTPDEITTHVLQRIGITPPALDALVPRLEAVARATTSGTIGPVVLGQDGLLRIDAFEPVVQRAWLWLAALAQSRTLLDADLVRALVEQSESVLHKLVYASKVPIGEARAILNEASPHAVSLQHLGTKTIGESSVGRLLRRILADAAERARADKATEITEAHLILAHLDRLASATDSLYVRLGLDPGALRAALAPAPAETSADSPGAIFQNGALALSAFGPVAAAAWRLLAPLTAERILLDYDLLCAFITLPESRLTETLHVIGAPVPILRRTLQAKPLTLRGAPAPSPLPASTPIPEARIGGLLRRVVVQAQALARLEHQVLVAESHLIRSHIDCVSSGSGNLYEKLGIDARRLHEAMSWHPTDAVPAASAASSSPGSTGAGDAGPSIEAYLNARVINQADAVQRAGRALRRMRSGLGEPGQVLGKFLFLGPTGVGKTELARAMADIAFGIQPGAKEAHMIRLDCGNFQSKWDVAQLIGAPQGLVGYKAGQLTNGLREKPRAVILFDEAEKADPVIWQSLLPLFDEGVVREADGTVYDATNCIMVATSNRGYDKAMHALNAFDLPWEHVRAEVEELVWTHVQTYFSPELLGRFGRENVIFFNHFSQDDYARMVDAQLRALIEEMAGRGITLTVDDHAAMVAFLVEQIWQRRREGARPVRRLITEHVRDQIVAARGNDPARTKFHFTGYSGCAPRLDA